MGRATTTKTRPAYRCTECGWETVRWVGRCGECQAWGNVEQVGAPRSRGVAGPVSAPARPITDIAVDAASARSSGVGELDRVLGGGLVPGAVLLLAGEPGVGKSTLLLEVAACAARAGKVALYISGEESAAQVRLRAERTRAVHDRLYFAAETDLAAVISHIEQVLPDLLVVDSVQTIGAPDVDGAPGGITQVREVSGVLTRVAKQRGISTILVGHVTKDGSVAGPRVLEHLVDVVLQFEGERNSRLRLVRAVKNRFGPVDEIGCFDLSDEGIVEVSDPTGLFVSRHHSPVPGTSLTVTLEGRRPLLAEVQALVAPSSGPGSLRRSTSGLDAGRVAMLLAVLERRAGLRLSGQDVYTATVGGARLGEPAADLATAVAVTSAALGRHIEPPTVVFGEVGLAGEIRQVPGVQRRLAEAARLGFTRAVVPAARGAAPVRADPLPGMSVRWVDDLGEALLALQLG
ncbi:MAG: DNA repair protein RadA [Actinomycetota bacterium]|jgi:DNA repair protein RadA/Sms|nr:DNA repair protein RadA [Actinomycetota bacterium]